MQFTDIKTLTYIGNNVSIDGIDVKIQTALTDCEAVQFHKGRDFCLEEPQMKQVPLSKYQYVLDEYVVAKELIDTQPEFTEEEILTRVKEKKLTEIDTAKKEAQLTPVTVRGVQFFGGRKAGQKYDEALRLTQRMGLSVGNFLSADSGMIEVDEPYATEVVVEVTSATYMLWAKAQEYNAQVNIATTVAEVEAIVWTA